MLYRSRIVDWVRRLGYLARDSLIIWPVALLGVTSSLAVFDHLTQQIQSRQVAEFGWLTRERNRALQHGIERALETVKTTGALFLVYEQASPEVFQVFANSFLTRIPGIQALAWVPEVPEEQRPAFENSAKLIIPEFQIQELSPERAMVIASGRPNYYPILYEALASDVKPTFGFDLGSIPQILAVIEGARDSGAMALTQRVQLPRASGTEHYGFFAFLPIYRTGTDIRLPEQRCRHLRGFVVGMFDIQKIADAAITLLEPRGVELLIEDETAPENGRFLDLYSSRLTTEATPNTKSRQLSLTAKGPHIKQVFPVVDRTWSVTSAQVPEYRSGEAFAEGPWFVLIGGLLLTALLCSYLYAVRRAMLDRIRMEGAIREREEIFSQMTETVDEVFWAAPVDCSRFLYISPGFERIWNIPRDEVYTRPEAFVEGIHPDDRPSYEQRMGYLQQSREPVEMLYRVMRQHNGVRWVRHSAFPVQDTAGRLYRIVGFTEDVTEKVLMEQALRESEQKLRTIFNQSPDILMMVDQSDRILMLNRSLPQLSADKAVGQDSGLLFPPELRDWYRHTLQQVQQSGEIDHIQYSLPDGSWWEARIVPIIQAEDMTATMIIAADITENRRLQFLAMHNARLATLGVLAAGVAHEINNPNNAIMFNASILTRVWQDVTPILRTFARENGEFSLAGLSSTEACSTLSQLISDIRGNSDRITKIVENLKHLGRQDNTGLTETLNLNKILAATIMILHSEIKKRTDHFTLVVDEDLPPVLGNPQQLEQVFINILLNALQALPDRSRSVEVSAHPSSDGKQNIISFHDQGTGIPVENFDRLKDPFFTTRIDSGGTGLGLFISNDIILRHRGSIEFSSEFGVGTSVSVRLPIATMAQKGEN